LDHHELAKRWNNNYLISLSIESEEKLFYFSKKLNELEIPYSIFTEPDIGDELTSLCFIETEDTKNLTRRLQVSLNNKSN
jgi:hypothetical protein